MKQKVFCVIKVHMIIVAFLVFTYVIPSTQRHSGLCIQLKWKMEKTGPAFIVFSFCYWYLCSTHKKSRGTITRFQIYVGLYFSLILDLQSNMHTIIAIIQKCLCLIQNSTESNWVNWHSKFANITINCCVDPNLGNM